MLLQRSFVCSKKYHQAKHGLNRSIIHVTAISVHFDGPSLFTYLNNEWKKLLFTAFCIYFALRAILKGIGIK